MTWHDVRTLRPENNQTLDGLVVWLVAGVLFSIAPSFGVLNNANAEPTRGRRNAGMVLLYLIYGMFSLIITSIFKTHT